MSTLVPVLDRNERTLLRELAHRFSHGLRCSIGIVSAAAVRAEHPDVKVALGEVVDLLQQQAELHRILSMPDRDGLVDGAEQIRRLGAAISRSFLKPVAISLAVVTDPLPLESGRCWRLALAVHELVSNAARHACFDGRDGAIKINLSLTGSTVHCSVADNGTISKRLRPARGLEIVGDLAKSLGGWIEVGFGTQVSSFVLTFPLTERERRASRAVASRRARGARPRKAVPPSPRPQQPRQSLNAPVSGNQFATSHGNGS